MGQTTASVTAPTTDTNFSQYSNSIPSADSGVGYTPNVNNTASNTLAAAGAATSFVPVLGLGLTLASTVMSSMEAKKAQAKQEEAQREAARKIEEMKRLTAQNEYAAIQVPVKAYERAFRENTAAEGQAINTLAQDPRTLIGAIQGVHEAGIEGQAQNTERLADRLYNDAMTKAGVRMGINQNLAKIASDEVSGAQIAAMAAEKAKIAQQQAMLQGIGGAITQGAAMYGTYGGFANAGDELQGLLGGTVFGKQSTQPTQDQLLQMVSKNPGLLMQLLGQQQKSTIG
jgi:hypothetical protein